MLSGNFAKGNNGGCMKRTAKKSVFSRRWHYGALLIGAFVILLFGYFLLSLSFTDTVAKTILPWALSIAYLTIIVLAAAIVYLSRLLKERSATRSFIANEAKKELAERLEAERAKQKLEVALLQGQKLQAIGTLAGGIAHDFNNLLYAIKGFTEMSRDDVEQNTLVYNNLGRVLEAVQRAQELVSRILTFGRREQPTEKVPVHIQTIIEGALGLLRPTIPTSVMINLIGLADDFLILGNQTQLHQVIVNIIINAVDAMEGEGTITIKLSHLRPNDDYLKQFSEISNTPYCRIDISDSGHGMDNLTMERIFEPFYTTKEVGRGTGLGLAMVHSIIHQHQGKITVSSQLGQGTMFTIILPEVAPPSIAPESIQQKELHLDKR